MAEAAEAMKAVLGTSGARITSAKRGTMRTYYELEKRKIVCPGHWKLVLWGRGTVVDSSASDNLLAQPKPTLCSPSLTNTRTGTHSTPDQPHMPGEGACNPAGPAHRQ